MGTGPCRRRAKRSHSSRASRISESIARACPRPGRARESQALTTRNSKHDQPRTAKRTPHAAAPAGCHRALKYSLRGPCRTVPWRERAGRHAGAGNAPVMSWTTSSDRVDLRSSTANVRCTSQRQFAIGTCGTGTRRALLAAHAAAWDTTPHPEITTPHPGITTPHHGRPRRMGDHAARDTICSSATIGCDYI